MKITIYSTLMSHPGQITIDIEPDETINTLITTFCSQQGIAPKRYFVIRDINQAILPVYKKIGTLQIEEDDTLYLGLKDDGTDCLCGCNQWWLLSAVALFIGTAGIIAIVVTRIQGNRQPMEYGIVIDAGSSHSELFVYKWRGDKNNGTAVARQINNCISNGGGISQYVDEPAKAGPSLEPCLDVAHQTIPANHRKSTEIYLGATAGMRLLEQSDNETCQQILNSVRSSIMNYDFDFSNPEEQARILTGEEEGTFSWITVNYLSDTFGKFQYSNQISNSNGKVGALDMGGASTQMTFIPENPDALLPNMSNSFHLYGQHYTVYTHSCLCYGQNEAQRQLHAHLVMESKFRTPVEDPCLPQGFNLTRSFSDIFEAPCTKHVNSTIAPRKDYTFIGSSNSDKCAAKTSDIFNPTLGISTPLCVLQQPDLYGDFKAFSGFYYTTSYLNISNTATHTEFENSIKDYCQLNWKEVEEIPVDESFADMRWLSCFRGHFIDILLTDKYGFNDNNWNTLSFVNQIDNTSVGWSLGFMLFASNNVPSTYPHQHLSLALFIIMFLLFLVFFIISGIFGYYAFKQKYYKISHQRLSDYGSM